MTDFARDYAVDADGSLWEKPPFPGEDVRLLAGFRQTLGAYSLIKCVTSSVTRIHTHAYDDESAYLLEGSVSVLVGEKTYDLEPGGFVYMPRHVPHQFVPHGEIVVLNIQTPGGVMDAIIEEIGEAVSSGKELDAEAFTELQLKHGIHAPDGWF
jgi:quercetin dioxygenase-like cupin family protein